MFLKKMKWGILFVALFLTTIHSYAQVVLVKDGKAKSRIVIAGDKKVDQTAAKLLQSFV